MKQYGTFSLPVVAVLPAGFAGQEVTYQGSPWHHDGTTWSRIGGGAVTARVVVDVGTRGKREHLVSVAADVAVGDRVQAWIDYTATPAKTADEFELDAVHVWCAVRTAGRLTVRLLGLTGPIAGEFPVDLLIAKG